MQPLPQMGRWGDGLRFLKSACSHKYRLGFWAHKHSLFLLAEKMFLQVDLRVNEMRLLQFAQRHLGGLLHHSKLLLFALVRYLLRCVMPGKFLSQDEFLSTSVT